MILVDESVQSSTISCRTRSSSLRTSPRTLAPYLFGTLELWRLFLALELGHQAQLLPLRNPHSHRKGNMSKSHLHRHPQAHNSYQNIHLNLLYIHTDPLQPAKEDMAFQSLWKMGLCHIHNNQFHLPRNYQSSHSIRHTYPAIPYLVVSFLIQRQASGNFGSAASLTLMRQQRRGKFDSSYSQIEPGCYLPSSSHYRPDHLYIPQPAEPNRFLGQRAWGSSRWLLLSQFAQAQKPFCFGQFHPEQPECWLQYCRCSSWCPCVPCQPCTAAWNTPQQY